MQPDTSRAIGGANARRIGRGSRSGDAQARRAGISVAVDDLIHPQSPSGAASGTMRRPSTIGSDAAPLGLGVRGRCARATKMPALRASRAIAAARTGDGAGTHGPNQPVEATETRGAVSNMKTGDRTGAKGLRASPHRWAHMKSLLLLLLLGLVGGCSDSSVTHLGPSEVSGMTPGGQKYSGVILTRRDGDFERYSIVIVAEGRAVTSMATSDTKVHVTLDRADRVEATWGRSVAVAGRHSETIPNEADVEATRRSLEKTLDAVLLKTPTVPN